MGPRLQPDERRALILAAARRAFTEHGFDAASMRAIATDSGVTTPVIYDHFPSKGHLYEAVLEAEAAALTDMALAVPDEGRPPEELVADAVDAFFAFVEQRPQAWRLLMRDVPTDPQIAETHRDLQARGEVVIEQLLRRLPGMSDELAPGLPASRAYAVAVRGVVNGLAQWWWERPEIPRERVAALATRLLTHGLVRHG